MSYFTFPSDSDTRESESESENEREFHDYFNTEYEDVEDLQDINENLEALWIWIRIIARHLFPHGLSSSSFPVTE